MMIIGSVDKTAETQGNKILFFRKKFAIMYIKIYKKI